MNLTFEQPPENQFSENVESAELTLEDIKRIREIKEKWDIIPQKDHMKLINAADQWLKRKGPQ